MSKARMEIDHAEQAAYVDFGVESRGVASAVEVCPTINVDLDPTGAAVGIELLSLSPPQVPLAELLARGRLRDDDARLIEHNLPVILEFLAVHPGASGVDLFYLAS